MYSVDGNGLRKINPKIELKENAFYPMGASSSPANIFVVEVSDKFIFYKNWPYTKNCKVLRVDIKIGKDMIITAINNTIKQYEAGKTGMMGNTDGWNEIMDEKINQMKACLNGTPKIFNPDDLERVDVTVVTSEKFDAEYPDADAWRLAEEFGSVSGKTIGDEEAYIIETTKGIVEEIKNCEWLTILEVTKPRFDFTEKD